MGWRRNTNSTCTFHRENKMEYSKSLVDLVNETLSEETRRVEETIVESQEVELLTEKQILYNGGKKYGQIVFLAGGAGSGKGFASENFMNSIDFRVRDVDEMKKAFLKIAKLKKKYPEIQGLELKNPKDVFKLHMFVKGKGIKEKTLDHLLAGASEGRLPNIMFDVTSKDLGDITDVLPDLVKTGYQPKDIHLTWILTKYSIAVKQNATRERVVPDDIMLKTHSGAANTMWSVIQKGKFPKDMDGGFYVVLNNRENTVFYTDKNDEIISNSKGQPVIKDFKYMTVKKPGGKMLDRDGMKKELHTWVTDNVPKTKLTQDIFQESVDWDTRYDDTLTEEDIFSGLESNVKKLIHQIIALSDGTLAEVTGLDKSPEVKDFVDAWVQHVAETESKAKDWKASFKDFTGKTKLTKVQSKKLS